MELSTVSSLKDIDADDWNRLAGTSNPFVRHDFLLALEQNQCLQPWGWTPAYQCVHIDGTLAGAAPAYIKDNSYGEFVFDWAWADAYHRHGLQYYPKLVIAVPYTPAQGPRLLCEANDNSADIKTLLVRGALAQVESDKLSSAHWLFCEQPDIETLQRENMLLRVDHQFHWSNQDYGDFDDYLSRMSSKKRKNIRRERRKVTDAGIRIDIKPGAELTEEEWHTLYHFYCITFMKKSGTATLSQAFFRAMQHKLVAILARYNGEIVAGAICFRGEHSLYGRHWGCLDDYDSLHFEVCYYAGIEYCINQGIQNFEPGAQGEHKIWRGFLPVKTRSAHYIAHEGFRQAIADFVAREQHAVDDYGKLLHQSSPFKRNDE